MLDRAKQIVPANRDPFELRTSTDPAWIRLAVERFDEVLIDHAHCEKKAAASAMALVSAYPDHDVLVKRMAKLAHEELRHFRQVHELILARGLKLGKDEGDPYAKELLRLVRTGSPAERRMDRLLVSALIEARSCERLELLSTALPDPALRSFYAILARAEAGHHRLFVDLAALYASADEVEERFEILATAEGEIVAALPIEARIH